MARRRFLAQIATWPLAAFGPLPLNPRIFVSLVEWADHIITE
jgi:hypothetical protein